MRRRQRVLPGRTILVQNDVSDREAIGSLSLDVVSHHETGIGGLSTSLPMANVLSFCPSMVRPTRGPQRRWGTSRWSRSTASMSGVTCAKSRCDSRYGWSTVQKQDGPPEV